MLRGERKETQMERESLDNYDFKEFIAKGAFGSVYLAIRKLDNKECAIKVKRHQKYSFFSFFLFS